MNDFAVFMTEHVRLALLRLLNEAPGYKANSSILTDFVLNMGLSATRDQVRTQLAWLREQGLVTTEEQLPGLLVATATERGLDVANALAHVPGVRRPAPKG